MLYTDIVEIGAFRRQSTLAFTTFDNGNIRSRKAQNEAIANKEAKRKETGIL